MVKLTKRQKLIYDEIVAYKEKYDGNTPSLIVLKRILMNVHGISLSDQTINEEIHRMSGLLIRDTLGHLIVTGAEWALVDPPEIEVIE